MWICHKRRNVKGSAFEGGTRKSLQVTWNAVCTSTKRLSRIWPTSLLGTHYRVPNPTTAIDWPVSFLVMTQKCLIPNAKDELLSRGTIEGLIAQGKKIIVVDKKVLKVDAWLPYHPGGDKTILHMVGKDATDEVNAYDVVVEWAL